MRKLKVSIICILAAVLCCAFALLLVNYSNAFSRAENPSAEITTPEHEAQKTAGTLDIRPWGFQANSTQPTGAVLSDSYTYNNNTFNKKIEVPYTGSPITVNVVSGTFSTIYESVGGPNITKSNTSIVANIGSTTIEVPAAVGTYTVTCTRYECTFHPTGAPSNVTATVDSYYATGPSTYTRTVIITIVVKATTKAISSCTITAPGAQTYTGSALTPAPTIKDGTTTLVKDTDYTLSYSNNTNVGTATITITGKGKYTGTATCTFAIKKAANPVKITSTTTSVVYGNTITMTGSGQGTLSWSSSDTAIATVGATTGVVTPVKAGTVTITLSAAGNASYNAGSATKSITVTKASQAALTISGTTTVVYGSTTTLTAGGGSGSGAYSWSSSDTSVATVNSSTGVVTPVKQGSVTITLTKATDSCYNQATKTVTITVQRKGVAVPTLAKGSGVHSGATASNQSASTTYNGAAQHFTISSTTNITFGTPTSGATRSGTDFYATNAGTYTVSISLDTNKYCWGSDNSSDINAKSLTLTIGKATISPTLTYGTVTYGTNSGAPTVGANPGGGTCTYSVAAGTGSATVNSSTGVITPTQAGNVTVTVSVAATTNYAAGTATATVTIGKATLTLTLSYSTVYVNNNSAAPTLGGNSGNGTPTYTIVNGTGVSTINSASGVLSPTQAGTVTVTVSVPETTNYFAGSKGITVTVSKNPVTLTLTYTTVTYGSNSAAPALGGNSGNGTPAYTIVNGTGTATVNPANGVISPTQAGTVSVTVSVPETTYYVAATLTITVNIEKATITPAITYPAVTYGTNSGTPTVTGNSGNGAPAYSIANGTGSATIDHATGIISPNRAGTVTVTVSIPETTNYKSGTANVSVTVLKADITLTLTYQRVHLDEVTAAPTLGGNFGNGTPQYTVTDESGSATISSSTGVLTPTAVGTVKVSVYVPATTNYNESSLEITVTVNKAAITLTLTYATVTYGSNSAAPTLAGNSGNGTPAYSVEGGTGSATIDPVTGVITPTQAGTVTVTVSVPETTSYEANTKTITVTIEKAGLTLTLNYPEVSFGRDSAAPTLGGNLGSGAPTYSLKNGTGSGTVKTTDGVISPTQAGTVSVTVTVAETTNYKTATLTIAVTIIKGELTAPEIDYGTVTYGTDSVAPTIKYAGDGVKTFAIAAGTGNATINSSTGVISPTRAGTVTVTLSVSSTINFNEGSYSITVTINKAAISPSFTYSPITYGKASEEPEITGNPGNTTPRWTVEDGTGIATINALNGVLTPIQAGTVKVTLSLPTGVNYLAGSVTLTVTIGKAAISPELTYSKVIYSINSAAPKITGNTENGAVSFIVTNGTGTATIDADTGILSPTRVGDVTVTLNIAETTNYAAGTADFTVTIGRLTVTEPKFDTTSSLNTDGLVFVDDLTAKIVYTGEQVYIAVNCPDGWATSMRAVLDGTVDETLWNASSGSAFVVAGSRATAGSKHKITITLKNDNFEFAGGVTSVSLTLSVTKQTIALPHFNTSDNNNTVDLVFSDGDTAAAYEYTGLQVYIAVTNIENWTLYMNAVLSSKVDSASWAASMGGVFLVNASNALGATTHTIIFNITDDNYVFDNEETTVVLTLTISKAELDVPVFDSADAQNSPGAVFSGGDTAAVIGYPGNDVYIGVIVADNWTLYMSADLSDGINATAWAAADGKAVTVDFADALAGSAYTVIFTITDDNYVFGNGETEVTLSLSITAKSITEEEITINLDENSFVYNGLSQTPEVTLEHDGASGAPVRDTDFAVKFINTAGLEVAEPTDAGTYTVVVGGLGNYTGESNTFRFTIIAADLNSATITLEQTEYGYDGKAKTPEVEIRIGDTVIASTFYSKQYSNNINAGTASVALNGIINFTGNLSIDYTINVRDISGVTFSALDTQEYTGVPYAPKPTVTDGGLGTTLIAGRDYDFVYEDNENAGTAKVIAVAKGNYGGEATATFEITARDITVVLIGAIGTQSFDGRAKTPAPEITDYKIRKTLTEGDDFEFVYENNYDAGVATLYIVGQNNYTGTYVFPFTINARSLEDAEFLSIDTQIYDGYNKTPTANIIENGWTLRRGIDYNISYTDNLNAGEATMTIIGIGNYTGMKSFPFTIYAKALDNAFDIDGIRPSYVYTGSAILPVPTVSWNGKTLSSELDYEVTYSDGFNAGTTVLVTVSGKGNYTGNKLVEFTITQATPTVEPDYDRTKNLHAGWGLPEITATVTFNGGEVSGVIAWQKINGEEPKLFDGEHIYGWVFTPTGNDAVNFVVVTGEMSIISEPVDVERITVTLVGEPKTYRAFEKFDPATITVVATLNDGTEIMIPKDYDIIYSDGRNCLWASDTYVTISHLTRGKTVTAEFSGFSVIKAIPAVNLSVDGKPAVGDTLSSVSLKSADGDTAGTYEWLAPDTVLETGFHTFTFRFTPEDADNYEVYEGSVIINIVILTDITVSFFQNGEELFTSDALEDLETLINDSAVQLTVKALYSDDTSKTLTLNGIVDGYTLEIAGSTLAEDGEVKVIFEDNGITLSKTFRAQVTVVRVERIEAELHADGLTVYTDTALEELRDLITVTAHYNNDSSRTVEDFDLIFTGDATKLTHGAAIIAVDYTGDYKGDNCQPFGIEIQNVIKHATELTYEGNTVFTYNGEEQVIDSGAVLNHGQDAHITYTVNGDPAAFTKVPESGKITVVIRADETEDYYPAEIEVVITVKKAKTVIDTTGVKRNLTYTGKEQKIEGAFIEDGEVGAEIVYYNNTFTAVPAGGKLLVTLAVAESENYLGTTQKIEVTVEKAKIDVNGAGETLYFAGKKLAISLDEKNDDGTYKNILAVSGENLKITYSQAYKLGEAVIPEPQDEKAYTAFKPEVDELGRYVVNVRITSNDNYETYFGQWLVEVEEEAEAPAAQVGGISIPLWAIAVIAVCAGLSVVAVAVAGVSIKRKPSAAPDNDGFYDTVDEETLASYN